jgi:hypothetical protein
MSLRVGVRFLVELGLSRLERLSILEFLAVEVKIFTHQTVQEGLSSFCVKFIWGWGN